MENGGPYVGSREESMLHAAGGKLSLISMPEYTLGTLNGL